MARSLERLKLTAAVAAILVTILPFLIVDHLPLVDLPNHIARLVIRSELGGDGPLARFYEWRWVIIPNLAIDLLSYPSQGLIDPQVFVTISLVLAVIGTYCGAIAVDRALNGPAWGMSLLVGVFMFHGALRAGFLNYVLGLAVAVPLFAAWIRCRPRFGFASGIAFTLAGIAVTLMHLFAFGLYVLCVAGYEIALLLKEKSLLEGLWRRRFALSGAGATLLIPLMVILLGPTTGAVSTTMWSTLHWKLEAFTAPVFYSSPWVELPLMLVVLLGLLGGFSTGMLRLRWEMMPVAALLIIAFLAMPRMLFGSYYADYRLLCGAVFFMVSGLVFSPRSSFWRKAMAAIGITMLVFRVGSIILEWSAAQPVLKSFDSAMQAVSPGARLLVLRATSASVSRDRSVPVEHIATLPAARRGVFVGNMFTLDAQQPLRLTAEVRPYYHVGPLVGPPLPLDRYDYVLAIDRPTLPPTSASLVEIRSAERYVLYRVTNH